MHSTVSILILHISSKILNRTWIMCWYYRYSTLQWDLNTLTLTECNVQSFSSTQTTSHSEWCCEMNSLVFYSCSSRGRPSFMKHTCLLYSYSQSPTSLSCYANPPLSSSSICRVSEGQFGEDLQLSANSDQLQLHKHHAPHVCTAAADGRMWVCYLSQWGSILMIK